MKPIKIPLTGLKVLIYSLLVLFFSYTQVFAAVDAESKKIGKAISYQHVLNWSLGLIIVLSLFFACIWMMRKMGNISIHSRENMKVVSALSLGMREKLILVQVGEKQLLLGVTPGRIENLLVLEDEEQLFQQASNKQVEGEFARKLKQLMSGSANE